MKINVHSRLKSEEVIELKEQEETDYLHTIKYGDRLTIQHNGQLFYLTWDKNRNSLEIRTDNTLAMFTTHKNTLLLKEIN